MLGANSAVLGKALKNTTERLPVHHVEPKQEVSCKGTALATGSRGGSLSHRFIVKLKLTQESAILHLN